MAQPSTPVWTPPSTPGNLPIRPGPLEYDMANQAVAPVTPLQRLDLVPIAASPGAASLWLNSATGALQLGTVSLGASNAISTVLDSVNGIVSPSTPLAMTPSGSTYIDIPAWTGGFIQGTTLNGTWSATAGSISITWNGPTRLGRFFFSISGTSASANQVYGFRLLSNGGYVNGATVQQNFTTTNAVSCCMEGIVNLTSGQPVKVQFNNSTSSAVLTATMINFMLS